MSERPVNFSAGPAILPLEVLEEASRAVFALDDVGLSILEISHRSPPFEAIIEAARDGVRRALGVPESHDVLFLQGGARAQFAQVPLNFLNDGQTAAYVNTGAWSTYAIDEAARLGSAAEVATGEPSGFSELPDLGGLELGAETAYVHTTSNNTIYGTQWQSLPTFGEVPHVCDMSSDIFSRPVDVSGFKLIYAGAQKNAGPAGVTLVIIDKAWMAQAREDIPAIWRYATHAAKDSMYNTPPTFPIYVVGLVTQWIELQGGVERVAEINERKAGLIYEAIDASDVWECAVAEPSHQSRMNVAWRTRDPELAPRFVAEAAEAGLSGLKGHRKVGGLRASIYNAMPLSGVETLVEFMSDFARKNA
ncbi:MAG: 3-phosphoserine/phosphohydroxythreonine aminotransferase [Deltaproteobacteria bacterium]|nr:3-phosphoserine/phosphohydroxythreonine aminotransferase [Deltaproteobacteria bacterium]